MKGSGEVLEPLGSQLPKVVLIRGAFRQSEFGLRQDGAPGSEDVGNMTLCRGIWNGGTKAARPFAVVRSGGNFCRLTRAYARASLRTKDTDGKNFH
jgi:hypothetical protein